MQTHTHNDSCRLQWGWRLNLNRFVIFLFFSFCQQTFLMTVIFYLTTITYNWHGNDELATKEERRHTPVNSTVDNNIIELTVKREHFYMHLMHVFGINSYFSTCRAIHPFDCLLVYCEIRTLYRKMEQKENNNPF